MKKVLASLVLALSLAACTTVPVAKLKPIPNPDPLEVIMFCMMLAESVSAAHQQAATRRAEIEAALKEIEADKNAPPEMKAQFIAAIRAALAADPKADSEKLGAAAGEACVNLNLADVK